MPYIVKEKLLLSDLVPLVENRHRVLLAEAEEYLAALYEYHLEKSRFHVHRLQELQGILSSIETVNPHVVIVNPESTLGHKDTLKILKTVTRTFPRLPIITVCHNIDPELLKQYMELGISSHINRRLSRPRDVVEVARTILQT